MKYLFSFVVILMGAPSFAEHVTCSFKFTSKIHKSGSAVTTFTKVGSPLGDSLVLPDDGTIILEKVYKHLIETEDGRIVAGMSVRVMHDSNPNDTYLRAAVDPNYHRPFAIGFDNGDKIVFDCYVTAW